MSARPDSTRKRRPRWSGFRRDPGGHFLQSDHKRRVRLGVIVVAVAVAVIVVTALIASRDKEPELELIDVESSASLALASATGTAPTSEPTPTTTTSTAAPPTSSPSTTAAEPAQSASSPTVSSTSAVATTSTVPFISDGAYGQTPAVENAGLAAVAGSLDVLGLYETFDRLDGSSLLGTPTPGDPLRIYVGGDSMSGTPGTALSNLALRNDLIQVVEDTRTSSGLVADWFFDWPQHMRENVSPVDYDVIVMMMGGNDGQRFQSTPGSIVGDDAWVTAYRDRMEQVMRSARSMGRLVIWIGMPPVTPSNIKVIAPLVNDVAVGLARDLVNVEYVDVYEMFLDDDGEFATHLIDANGKRVRVRSGDGVHFYNIAGYWMADEILSLIEQHLDVGATIR